jgi:hypothetical protein
MVIGRIPGNYSVKNNFSDGDNRRSCNKKG